MKFLTLLAALVLCQPTHAQTAMDIYKAINVTAISMPDAVQGVMHTIAGSTNQGANGVGSYFQNDNAGTNAVGLFTAGIGTAANVPIWGINTLLQDNSSRATHSRPGQIIIGYEADFNITGAQTKVLGISIGGNSIAQPASANGFIVNTLGGTAKWDTGFWCMDGMVRGQCIAVGASATTGINVPSQNVILQYLTSVGAHKWATLRASENSLLYYNNDSYSALSLGWSGLSAGRLFMAGSASGATWVDVQPNAAGFVRFPNANGTLVATATWPLVIDPTTGNISCATCPH